MSDAPRDEAAKDVTPPEEARDHTVPDAEVGNEELAVPQPQVGEVPATVRETRGMWATGTGDTSGYGGIAREFDMPGTAEPPFGGWYDQVADRLAELIPGLAFARVTVDRDEITFYVDPAHLVEVMRNLRDDAHLRFEVCMSVSGVHYPEQTGSELHVVYHLLSYTHNRRVRVETACSEADPHVPSVTSVYPMADYHERETWDMFGVIFDAHPALTRILMPDDWQGHPQRKDYPLGGIPVEYKGAVVPPADQRRKYNA